LTSQKYAKGDEKFRERLFVTISCQCPAARERGEAAAGGDKKLNDNFSENSLIMTLIFHLFRKNGKLALTKRD
jgi:hypothetical protein